MDDAVRTGKILIAGRPWLGVYPAIPDKNVTDNEAAEIK